MPTAPSDLKKGDDVSWKWGASHPSGKVDSVVEGDASISTKNGNTVNRHGDEEDPAVKIKQGKNSVIKLAHELDGVDPEASGSGDKEEAKDEDEEEEEKTSKKPASKSKKPTSKKAAAADKPSSAKPASKAKPAAKPASKKKEPKEDAPPAEGTRKSSRSNKGTHSAPKEDDEPAAGTKRKPASKDKEENKKPASKKAKKDTAAA